MAVVILGFQSRNHPQQVRAQGADDEVDDRWTPLHLWIPWNARWGFTLDAAASHDNHLCDRYFTLEQDGLKQSWAGARVWCNPPYSAMRAWVEKAWAETSRVWEGCSCPGGDSCGGFTCSEAPAELVVMLAPANRTEQRWWQESIEPTRDRGGVLSTEFLPRRINFASKDNLGAWYPSSAPFGCVLLIWDRAVVA